MYDKLLYEAYGYHLDETDERMRRLQRDAEADPESLQRINQRLGVEPYVMALWQASGGLGRSTGVWWVKRPQGTLTSSSSFFDNVVVDMVHKGLSTPPWGVWLRSSRPRIRFWYHEDPDAVDMSRVTEVDVSLGQISAGSSRGSISVTTTSRSATVDLTRGHTSGAETLREIFGVEARGAAPGLHQDRPFVISDLGRVSIKP